MEVVRTFRREPILVSPDLNFRQVRQGVFRSIRATREASTIRRTKFSRGLPICRNLRPPRLIRLRRERAIIQRPEEPIRLLREAVRAEMHLQVDRVVLTRHHRLGLFAPEPLLMVSRFIPHRTARGGPPVRVLAYKIHLSRGAKEDKADKVAKASKCRSK